MAAGQLSIFTNKSPPFTFPEAESEATYLNYQLLSGLNLASGKVLYKQKAPGFRELFGDISSKFEVDKFLG